MKLASYRTGQGVGYGAVTATGIVDLGRRLPYASLLDVLRAGALGEARAAAGAPPDVAVEGVAFLPPVIAPEKILCVGVDYANRNAEYRDGSEQPKYPSLFFRTPGSFVGHDQGIVRPAESIQLDYEGEIVLVIGREGRRVPRERAMGHVAGVTL